MKKSTILAGPQVKPAYTGAAVLAILAVAAALALPRVNPTPILVLLCGAIILFARSLQARLNRYSNQMQEVESRIQSLIGTLGQDAVDEHPLDPQKLTEISSFAKAVGELETSVRSACRELQDSGLERGRIETARRAAQELRPPVAVLSLILQRLPDLNADSIEAAQGALTKIRAVTADLLRASGEAEGIATSDENVPQSEPLLAVVERVLTEKRQTLRERPRVRLESGTLPGFPGPFARVEPRALERILADLIDNAVDSLIAAEGKVRIDLLEFAQRGFVELRISDDGVGVPQEVISTLGTKRSTAHGRESGHGLYHAFHRIKEWGGQMTLARKPDRGTLCSIRLPLAPMPSWFASPIRIPAGGRVLVLEKDPSVMNVWSNYASLLYRTPDSVPSVALKLVTRGVDFDAHLRESRERPDLNFVSQELGDELVNGLDLIAANRVANKAILVAWEFESRSLRRRAERLGVRILPKELIEAAIAPEIRHLLRGYDTSPELKLGLIRAPSADPSKATHLPVTG